MNKSIFAFIGGAAFGSLVTYFIVSKKKEAEKQAEIEEIRESYHARAKAVAQEARNKPTLEEVVKSISPAPVDVTVSEEEGEANMDIYFITPQDFIKTNGFDKLTLTCYSDDIVADHMDDVYMFDDPVYAEAIHQVHQYSNTPIYIRDMKKTTEYEFVYEERTFYEATGIYIDRSWNSNI